MQNAAIGIWKDLVQRRIAQSIFLVLAAYGIFSTPGLAAHWGISALGLLVAIIWLLLASPALFLARGWSPSWRQYLLLGIVIVTVRSLITLIFINRVPGGDAFYYPEIAGNLLSGRGYVVDEPYIGPGLRAFYPPAYPTLLAGWGFLGGFSAISYATLNLLIDGTCAVLVARLGKRLAMPLGGRAAAWLYLLWPSILLSAPLAQKEGMCNILVLSLALFWTSVDKSRPLWKNALFLGIPAGLLALTQPAQAPLAALFSFFLIRFVGWKKLLVLGMSGGVVAAVVLLPWWIRNWLIFGAFVPLTTASSVSLWIGNNPDATGNWMPTPKQFYGEPERLYMAHVRQLAVSWIETHPFEFIRLSVTKMIRATAIACTGLVRIEGLTPSVMSVTTMLFPLAQGVHIALLGGVAAVVQTARRTPGFMMLLLLLAACGAQLVLFNLWFEFGERHREFVTPFLLLIIGYGLSEARVKSRAEIFSSI